MRSDNPARGHVALPSAPGAAAAERRSDWSTLKRLLPYLWQYKWRVMAALAFMVAAKGANVAVPVLLKQLVDAMSIPAGSAQALLVVPLGLLLAYGGLRLCTSLFTELRELVFAKATEGATRHIALEVFGHLHSLSLRFHLERQTGGMTRDIERGTRGVQSLISYSLYSIVPTLIEVAMVLTLLGTQFDMGYVWITLAALVLYVGFTVVVTEWRTQFRRRMNELESVGQTRAIDSLLNYETVKYFNNEAYEAARYDEALQKLRKARLVSQRTLSLLNTGQQLIIATALVLMLWRATQGVVTGNLTLGDLVMINAFMIQLYIPLGFLGVLYREIKQRLTDLDKMFVLLEKEREVADAPGARPLVLDGPPAVRFENVHFSYEPAREILHGVSFEIPAGKTVAVVGPSGSGKSTLARLVMALEPPSEGRVLLDGQDLHALAPDALRRARKRFQMVFQDPYGSLDPRQQVARIVAEPLEAQGQGSARERRARAAEMLEAVGLRAGDLGKYPHEFSGGQRQRIAIARALVTRPALIVADEPVSALDVSVQAQVLNLMQDLQDRFGVTYLFISHDLAVVDLVCDEVIVLHEGREVERGDPDTLFREPRHAYTRRLLEAIPQPPAAALQARR